MIGFDWSQLDFLIWQCRMLYSAQQWLYHYGVRRNSGARNDVATVSFAVRLLVELSVSVYPTFSCY